MEAGALSLKSSSAPSVPCKNFIMSAELLVEPSTATFHRRVHDVGRAVKAS